jgi:hypothetical protein
MVPAIRSQQSQFEVVEEEPANKAPVTKKSVSKAVVKGQVIYDDDKEVKSSKKRVRAVIEDNNQKRIKEEEDEDKPRRSRGDDEEDEEPRPRPRAKKKKKKSRSRQGGGFAEWGIITKVLVVCAAIWAISFALGFVWPPLMFLAVGVGAILTIVGGIMFLIVVIQDDIVQVLLCFFVPFYSLFYLVTHFDECKHAFFIQMAGFGFLTLSMFAGVGTIAVMGKPEPPKKVELDRPAPVAPLFIRV